MISERDWNRMRRGVLGVRGCAWSHYGRDWASLPKEPGVYAIFQDDRLIYVGSSTNLRGRMSGHRVRFSGHKNISIRARIVRRAGDWFRREYRLIVRLKPELNLRHAVS